MSWIWVGLDLAHLGKLGVLGYLARLIESYLSEEDLLRDIADRLKEHIMTADLLWVFGILLPCMYQKIWRLFAENLMMGVFAKHSENVELFGSSCERA